MKKILFVFCAFFCLAGAAQADVSTLSAKFRGGCSAANTNGSCTIGATATGSELASDSVVLQRSDTQSGRYKNVSATPKSLSDSGSVTFKFRNKSGCYRVVTAENGNDAADVRSKAICEK